GDYLFGGFVIAQAIVAATRDAPEGRRLHSLHAYFLRPVLVAHEILYGVRPVREGRTFTTRRLEASQDGKAVLDMSCSFTADTQGMVSLDHAAWFHRQARADSWLFYDVQSLVNAGGRGLLRGTMRDTEGRVTVSVAQEMRLTPVDAT